MSKSSARDNDRDETVRSEISCGICVTADDKETLPNDLVHLTSHNDVIMEMDVED